MAEDLNLAELDHSGVSGFARIFERERLHLDRGLGLADREQGLPNTAATVFDIGSIAKTFTAAAVLRLHDAGALRVSDTLAQHFRAVPDDKAAITLEQLLTHSSGLVRYISDSDFEPITRDEVIRRALDAPLRATPGSAEQYGEANYALLAAVVEQTSSLALTDYVRAQLLTPLQLSQTGWYADQRFERAPIATGYLGSERQGNPGA